MKHSNLLLATAILLAAHSQSLPAQGLPASTTPVPSSVPAVSAYDTLVRSAASLSSQATPLTQPTLSPGVLLLMELEGRFAQSVASGGGKAFATWFADDAVTLNNGRPAVLGRAAIAGPANDMGFTWGHYEGRTTDKNGEPVVTSGRYFTVWKKLPDGTWKVAMDASANEPPAAAECCTLPKP